MSLGRKETKEKAGAHAEFYAHPILFLSVSNKGKEDRGSSQFSMCPGCNEGGKQGGQGSLMETFSGETLKRMLFGDLLLLPLEALVD